MERHEKGSWGTRAEDKEGGVEGKPEVPKGGRDAGGPGLGGR